MTYSTAVSAFQNDGISILPALMGEKPKERECLYWEFHEKGFHQAVRMGDWKGVRDGMDEPVELYDLSVDIGEKNNVAGEHPDVVAKIEALLKTERIYSEQWPVS